MPKVFFLTLSLGFIFLFSANLNLAHAQQITISPQSLSSPNSTAGFKITVSGVRSDKTYGLHLTRQGDVGETSLRPTNIKSESNGSFQRQLCRGGNVNGYSLTTGKCNTGESFKEGTYKIRLVESANTTSLAQTTFTVTAQTAGQIQFINTAFTTSNNIIIDVLSIPQGSYKITVDDKDPSQGGPCVDTIRGAQFFRLNIGKYYEGDHVIRVYKNERSFLHPLCGQGPLAAVRSFKISSTGGVAGPIVPGGVAPPPIVGVPIPTGGGTHTSAPSTHGHGSATVCPNPAGGRAGGCDCEITLGGTRYQGLSTAVGCVPTQPVGLVKALLTLSLAVSGSVAFLIIIMGVFQMLTSAGNPDQLKNGSQILTNAIIGILFLIFSVLILEIIGFGILNIPGFG